ncbi:hypothetical protein ECDEC2B_2438 [Escherichia coli DEC2B]|uniref:Uncharacterized protein n=1 Tax=Escherichia coli DEC2D TaxID=868141 RepID=A0A828U490_ECOLX|nr:hypothetical protein ECDEC2B_2438 [Escherichia coli DEC2B]EHU45136.1 hypothetical protein ECDEC2D_2381 [Escherichia coli DEC2D]KEL48987.1 hypothetical protein AB22_3455 [Escherichia coli 6-175-07_S1_C1]
MPKNSATHCALSESFIVTPSLRSFSLSANYALIVVYTERNYKKLLCRKYCQHA